MMTALFNHKMFSFLAGILLLSSFLALPPVSYADSSGVPSDYLSVSQLPADSPHRNTQLFYNTLHTFFCVTLGQSPLTSCLEYKILKDAQGTVRSVPVLNGVNTNYGIVGSIASIMTNIYAEPPIKTSEYIAVLGRNMGLLEEVNAQVKGSGNAVLSPIFNLWETSRNFAYLAMILIFLVIGFMVMFRQKLNPQTVVSVQLALPGLVIGLVLITFSYFLAAVITDTAFIGTDLVGYFFSTAQRTPGTIALVDQVSNKSVLDIFSPFLGIMSGSQVEKIIRIIYQSMDSTTQSQLSFVAGLIAAQFLAPVGAALPPPIGLFTGPIFAALTFGWTYMDPPTVFSFVLPLIAVLALIYQMLKLLLKLITVYLTLIFLTISAPFQFLVAALPGRQGIGSAWMLNMLGNALVFPAVLAVFYFIAIILGRPFPGPTASINPLDQNALISPAYAQEQTLVGKFSLPLLGGIDLSFVQILLAFGALMALPGIPDVVIKTVGKVGQAGQILGSEISGGMRSGQGYYQQGQGALSSNASQLNKSFFGETSPHWTGSEWAYTRSPSIWGHFTGQKIGGLPGARPPAPTRTGL